MAFAPVWRLFYIVTLVLLLAQLAIKLTALARGSDRWEKTLELIPKLLGAGPTALLAFTKVYFVPTSPAANLHALAQINYWMKVSFRIVLVVVVMDLLVECWRYLRCRVPAQRLAL